MVQNSECRHSWKAYNKNGEYGEEDSWNVAALMSGKPVGIFICGGDTMRENIPTQLTLKELLGESLFEVWKELCAAIDEKYEMER